MALGDNPGVFKETLLPEGEKRWTSLGAGLGLECLALALLILIPLVLPERLQLAPHYWITPIETPVVRPWKPQPKPRPVVVRHEVLKEVIKPAVVVPRPRIYDPVMRSPVARAFHHRVNPVPEVAELLPKAVSLGSSAIPKLRQPVQTGGFGDPNSVADNHNVHRNPNMTNLGAFDLPAGPGMGNGTGGKHGARGTVASAGFGNGVAVGGSGGPRGAVEQGVFASEQAASAPKMKRASVDSNIKPVVILSVPRPVYTAEGRAKKVQGVVLLQVVFTAAGDVKIERVIQGLGYGLDQAAEDAAHHIRFRPATRDGRPVDFSAVARIVFELAY